MKTKSFIVASCALLVAASLAHSATIVDFGFNNNLTNNGTYGGTASFVPLNSNPNNYMPTYSANAGGVSGLPGDYALDNTSASGMGGSGVGGAAQLNPFTVNSTTFTALTITGWFKTSTSDESAGRIFSTNNGTNMGMQLLFGGDNWLRFQVINNGAGTGTGSADSSVSTSLNSNGSWIFIGVVYGGANNVKFYVGNTTTSVSLLNHVTSNFTVSSIGTRANEVLNVANASGLNSSTQRPWDGLIDNFRIDDTALDLAQIENIRQAALIPEPSTVAMLMAGLAGGVLFYRSRKRRK